MNALRGHSNIQGLTDHVRVFRPAAGLPVARRPTRTTTAPDVHRRAHASSRCGPNQMSFWQNFAKFHVSLQKALWGDAATTENDFAYDYLPKLDGGLRRAGDLRAHAPGQDERLLRQGFNPLAALPNKKKVSAALSKLKFLVVIDPLRTETSRFWKNHGDQNDVNPEDIQTEVIPLARPPASPRTTGTFTNSGRLLQWHWAGGRASGRSARSTREIMARCSRKLRALYAKDGGTVPEPILKLTLALQQPQPAHGRRGAARDQRPRARRRRRPEGPDQGPA